MARRTTDLLDVFRDRGTPGKAGKGDGAATGTSAKPPRKSFEGLFLHPRQLLLGSSVVVLLLVFAFVLGLSVGRRGGSGSSGDALQASAGRADGADAMVRRVYVLGRVPLTNATGLAANAPEKLLDTLTERYSVKPEHAWITEDPNGKQWVLILGPFATEQQGAEYLMSHSLMKGRVGGIAPFQNPVYRSYLPSDLPRQRLPAPR